MKERTKEMVRLNCCVIGYWKIIVMYKHRSLFSDTHFYPLTLPTVQIWGASEKISFLPGLPPPLISGLRWPTTTIAVLSFQIINLHFWLSKQN